MTPAGPDLTCRPEHRAAIYQWARHIDRPVC
jgi:hypothetical protein